MNGIGAVAFGLLTIAAGPAQACYHHSFDTCPSTGSTPAALSIDANTGRTWVADADKPSPSEAQRAARGFAGGAIARASERRESSHAAATDWSTKVAIANQAAGRQTN